MLFRQKESLVYRKKYLPDLLQRMLIFRDENENKSCNLANVFNFVLTIP